MLRSAKPALCRPFGVIYATQPDANESRTFRTFDHYYAYAQRNCPSTVQEAARLLGVTVEAARGRIHRGTYMKEKTAEGRVFVRLTPKQLAEAPQRADTFGHSCAARSRPSDANRGVAGPERVPPPGAGGSHTRDKTSRHHHHAAITMGRDHRSVTTNQREPMKPYGQKTQESKTKGSLLRYGSVRGRISSSTGPA
jgi:hypothetical protein